MRILSYVSDTPVSLLEGGGLNGLRGPDEGAGPRRERDMLGAGVETTKARIFQGSKSSDMRCFFRCPR